MPMHLYGILSMSLRLYDVGLTGYSGPHTSMVICTALQTGKSYVVWRMTAKILDR